MRSVLVFAIYVLKNWKLSATPLKWLGVATHRLGTAELDNRHSRAKHSHSEKSLLIRKFIYML